MWTSLAALVVAFLPGAVWFCGPWATPRRRMALTLGEQVFWAIVLSVAWSCGTVLVLAAAGEYSFSRLLVANVGVAVLVAGLARFRLRWRPPSGSALHALVPAGLVLGSLALYVPPSEYVMGGKDPGTYVNEGIQIAQRGGLTIEDPVVAGVPPPFRDLFFPSHQNPTYYSLRFMGFFIQDPDKGTVIGQFPHLYPASIALGYDLNGLSGARQAVVGWTVLGILAWYFLGARLLGGTVAGAASALLAINVITVWFARYPNAEVVMLALLGAALLAAARALVDEDRFFGPVAGLLLGLLIFLRFDAILAVGAAVAGVALARADGRRIGSGFWVTLLPLLAVGAWYLAGPMKAYLAYPVLYVTNLPVAGVFALAVAGLTVLVVLPRLMSRPGVSQQVRRWTPAAYALVMVGLAVHAAAFRQAVGRVAWHDAASLRTFTWYLTTPGVVLAVLGLLMTSATRFWRDPTFFATAGAYAVFFFYKIRIVPQHFWMTRRYLPVILPAALLMGAALVSWLVARLPLGAMRRRDTVRAAATVLALVPLAVAFWTASRPVAGHVEYAGLIPRLESLAARFADNDLVLVESRGASDAHVLALPLAYIYARHVLVLASPRPDKAAFARFLDWARTRYRNVYFIGGGGTDLLSRRIGTEAAGGDRFQVPEYESPTNAYPSGVRHKEFDFSITRFVPPRATSGAFALDVGTNDDLLVVRFHAKEEDPSNGMTFRWSRDSSYISIPGMLEATRTLTIWMGEGGRPDQLPPAQVTLTLDDVALGTVTTTNDVRAYTFAIPEAVAGAAARRDEPARLRLTTSTWHPHLVLGTPDDRDLGVLVDRLEVR